MPRIPSRPIFRASLAAAPIALLALIYGLSAHNTANAAAEYRIAFAEYDANGDGAITEAELAAQFATDPFRAPAACAGTWVEEEAALSPEARAAAELPAYDANGDGVVAFAELAAIMQRERAIEFLELDADENGVLTEGELIAAFAPAEDDQEEQAALAEEEGLTLDCLKQLEAQEEEIDPDEDLAIEAEARLMIAERDADRDGQVSLLEYIEN
ncbi:MAG: hypothetical protein AAF401_03690 [Pseudomonadota bacterium]